MKNEAELLWRHLYERIGAHTPLHGDCGALCGAACCGTGVGEGMLLFPGEAAAMGLAEEALATVALPGGVTARLYRCGGTCQRDVRPLSCRIFPLHMRVRGASARAVMHPWARPICPLVSRGGVAGLSRSFVAAVEDVARVLMAQEDTRVFLTALDAQVREGMAHPLFETGPKT